MRIYYLVLLAGILLPAAATGQGTEIVRGRVTGADHKPLADVTVTITGLTTQSVLTARTTDKGIFTALFPNVEGDYLINVRKIGFAPYNTRLTRTGLTSVLVADVTLKELAFELDTIVVSAKRPTPRGGDASVGGVEQNLLTGALFSLDPTDLLALAGQIPGILSLGDSGFSVLGAGANANNATLDGAKF
ncbi:MAG: carboxypeptidase-like regulatory domain-containing protein, partial [Gemmatimonadales bacterium]